MKIDIKLKGKLDPDKLAFEVPCPKCGRKIKHTLGGLKRPKKVRCVCGAETTIKGK